MAAVVSPKPSQVVSRGLAAATVALKVAREATDAVPIAKQILGSAAHIFELAEKIQKNREAMQTLAEKAVALAGQIDEVVDGRTVEDGLLLRRLQRLRAMFRAVEGFMAKEAAITGRLKKTFRGVFVAPGRALQLAADLEREIQAFTLTAALDTRLRLDETAAYDGEFRLLRDCDVDKGAVLRALDADADAARVVFARADVHNRAMVVRYLQLRSPGVVDAVALGETERSRFDMLRKISTVRASHPNIVRLYGRRRGLAVERFTVLRSGVHDGEDFMKNMCSRADISSAGQTAMTIFYKMLDAARYLKEELGMAWVPRRMEMPMTMDNTGEPTIGVFDDLQEGTEWESGLVSTIFHALCVLSAVRGDVLSQRAVGDGGTLHELLNGAGAVPGSQVAQVVRKLAQAQLGAKHVARAFPVLDESTIAAPCASQARSYFSTVVATNSAMQQRGVDMDERFLRQVVLQGPASATAPSTTWVCLYDAAASAGKDSVSLSRYERGDPWHRHESYSVNLPETVAADVRSMLGIAVDWEGTYTLQSEAQL